MWTNMSSPPWEGQMNPWPCDLEKFLQMPLKTGPDLALTDLTKHQSKEALESTNMIPFSK